MNKEYTVKEKIDFLFETLCKRFNISPEIVENELMAAVNKIYENDSSIIQSSQHHECEEDRK